jgi:plastocyanin
MSVRFTAVFAVLIFATACSGNSSSAPSPTPPGDPATSVSIPRGAESLGNRAFAPDELTVQAGATVTWTNTDSEAHTSTSNAAGWNSGVIAPGRQFSFAFATAGTFQYHCAIHPGMVGTVVVR